MRIGRWHIQYLGTMIGDFDTGWRTTLRRRDFHREDGFVIGSLGPFQFLGVPKRGAVFADGDRIGDFDERNPLKTWRRKR